MSLWTEVTLLGSWPSLLCLSPQIGPQRSRFSFLGDSSLCAEVPSLRPTCVYSCPLSITAAGTGWIPAG